MANYCSSDLEAGKQQLEKILNKYGISQYELNRERNFIEILDDIYIKMDSMSLLSMMNDISDANLEIFGGIK